MMTQIDPHAAARQRLLAVSSALLEALYEPAAVPVLATLRPADMRPGGARVPGTSYELDPALAARAMGALLALRGVQADALVLALAQADQQARYATLAGQAPPTLASLYMHCMPADSASAPTSFGEALDALCAAAEKLFTPTQARRIADICQRLRDKPALLDQIPVQQFIAGFVRNAP